MGILVQTRPPDHDTPPRGLPVTVTTDRIGCPVAVAVGASPISLPVLQVVDRWHVWNDRDTVNTSACRDVWIVETSAGRFALHHLYSDTPYALPKEEIFCSDSEGDLPERYWRLLDAPPGIPNS